MSLLEDEARVEPRTRLLIGLQKILKEGNEPVYLTARVKLMLNGYSMGGENYVVINCCPGDKYQLVHAHSNLNDDFEDMPPVIGLLRQDSTDVFVVTLTADSAEAIFEDQWTDLVRRVTSYESSTDGASSSSAEWG